MAVKFKFVIMAACCIAALILAVAVGSVFIPPDQVFGVLAGKLFGFGTGPRPDPIAESIIWSLRLPRALLAFITGAGLAVSGVIMQSVLGNPLASAYTLGVSSGAAVGASLVIALGLSFFGMFTLPVFGLAFGLATVFLAVSFASMMDKNIGSFTIILTGMAFSLFANGIITLMHAFARQELQLLVAWQMGSFALKDWSHPAIMFPAALAVLAVAMVFAWDMDLMTFGEEQAAATGVDLKRAKLVLISAGAVITGVAVSLTGVIGFIDLFTPHVARKLFGARHKLVVPASALLGGCFMLLCDLLARVAAAPLEIPVGAVTSIFGAPFFIYLYFSRKTGRPFKRKRGL
ncbi:MAG: iron ABC transporter permease [Clostridiales bacterium]|jgi:iron complex transport system permease protein|nr:iron ABC transporter permease [Clostridiales bacterium]